MSYYVKGMGAALIAECNQERLTFRGGTGLLVCQLRDTLKFADAAEARIRALEAELKLQDQANDIMTHLLRKISRDYDRPGDWMPELQGALRSALETAVALSEEGHAHSGVPVLWRPVEDCFCQRCSHHYNTANRSSVK